MSGKFRSRLTYANVMSTIGVFLALGGGAAYAADTVFSIDIVDGEVKNPDYAADSIAGGKVVNNSLRSADVENLTGGDVIDDALTGADVRESSLGEVPLASSVANGAITSSKFATMTRKNALVVVPGGAAGNGSYATRETSVSCSPGIAFGGSAYWGSGKNADDELPLIKTSYSHDGNRPVGFHAEGGNDTSQDTTLVVAVHCLQP
jgi:hypothetical protein